MFGRFFYLFGIGRKAGPPLCQHVWSNTEYHFDTKDLYECINCHEKFLMERP